MPGSDSLSVPLRADRGGPLQFLCQTVRTFHLPYAGGFLAGAFPSSSLRPWPSPSGSGLGSPLSGAVSCPGLTSRRGRVRVMLRTVRSLAPLSGTLSAGFTGWISPASLPRCRSATRQLGLYRDRTFTSKPDKAYLDTHPKRQRPYGRPLLGRGACLWGAGPSLDPPGPQHLLGTRSGTRSAGPLADARGSADRPYCQLPLRDGPGSTPTFPVTQAKPGGEGGRTNPLRIR